MHPSETGDHPLTPLHALLAEYMERRDQGESLDPERFVAEHPAYAEELRAYFRVCQDVKLPSPALTVREARDSAREPSSESRPFDYDLLAEIAHGGMGVVYKARQVSLNRLVALKVIRTGARASAEERRRFRAEAEAVALLEHPHVVPIYEVGEYQGQPFLSMKLIEGGSLADAIDEGRFPNADWRAVARLMIDLADAVDHAHRHGVLHRDLKPANVLLDERGHSYVTDFGLAKRFESDSDLSQSGTVVGTPMYMAPEQAQGRTKRLTTATDVYGLGAILYECLTGRPPFLGDSVVQTLSLVLGVDPTPASRERKSVPRDLDVVCLKCLEKDPARRYPSARALADDLQRFLDGEPIQARPIGVVERAWRGVKRHPIWTMLAVLVLGGVLALGVTYLERSRASRRALDAKESAAKVYDSLEHWLANNPGMDDEQRKLAEWIREKYELFAREDGTTPELRREIARAQFRIGEISRGLKDASKAEEAYGRAIALQEKLSADYPHEPAYREELAESYNWLGELHRTEGRNVSEGEKAYRQALALQTGLAGQFPEEPRYRRLQARSLFNLGIVEMDSGRREDARDDYDRAIALLQPIATRDPEPASRHELARCRINRGLLLHAESQLDLAEKDFREAILALRQLTREPRVIYRLELAVADNNLGNLMAEKGKPKEAREAHEEALALTRQLVVFFPGRPEYRRELGQTHNSLGAVVWSKENAAPAREHWRQAREHFATLVQEHPDTAEYQALLGQAVGNLGWLLSEEKNDEEACRHFEESLRAYAVARKANPSHPDYLRGQRHQYQNLAETRLRQKEWAKASAAAEALAGDPPEPLSRYFAACFLARCAAGVTRADEARRYADRALVCLGRAVDAGFRDKARVEKDRSAIFKSLEGRPEFQKLLGRIGK